MNKLRYKDSKGDPRGFVAFLRKNGQKLSLIPRYRGNRLHILFKTCQVFVQHGPLLEKFFKTGTACPKLRDAINKDFNSPEARIQFVALAVVGEVLSAPWMKAFYRSPEEQLSYSDAIVQVKEVLQRLKAVDDPLVLLSCSADLFGDRLQDRLRYTCSDPNKLQQVLRALVDAVIQVIERQYAEFLDQEPDDAFRQQTKSARTSNIDAEELVGMFSAAQGRAPSGTMELHASKIKATKNKTVEYLDGMCQQTRDALVMKAVSIGKRHRQRRKRQHDELKLEIIKRQEQKAEDKIQKMQNSLERTLRRDGVEAFLADTTLPEVGDVRELNAILDGDIIGRNIVHIWRVEKIRTMYYGVVLNQLANKKYKIKYWQDGQSRTEKELVAPSSLAVDWAFGDLVFE